MAIYIYFLIFFAGGIEAGLVLSAVISLLMLLHFMKCHRWIFILIWRRWSFSWVSHRVLNLFYWGRLFAFTASSACRSLQIQCQGKGDEITNIYINFFFQLISLQALLFGGPFHFFFLIVVVFFIISWLYFILFIKINYSVATMHPCKMELLLL